MRRVTVRDVAHASGVSIGTVSKALSGRGQLSEATRSRVLLSARELGYEPVARPARKGLPGRTGHAVVGLVSHNVSDRFLMPLLSGVQRTLERSGVAVLLCEA
ncbi:LacI family DNA-binding transcriptional regulator, partial [Kitasatospora indigofera]